MVQIGCTPSPVAARARGGRVPRRTRWLATMLAQVIVVGVLGCRQDVESPTGPEPSPALDVTPAHALSFRQMSAGGSLGAACGVTTKDRAYCWGNNDVGPAGQRHKFGAGDL